MTHGWPQDMDGCWHRDGPEVWIDGQGDSDGSVKVGRRRRPGRRVHSAFALWRARRRRKPQRAGSHDSAAGESAHGALHLPEKPRAGLTPLARGSRPCGAEDRRPGSIGCRGGMRTTPTLHLEGRPDGAAARLPEPPNNGIQSAARADRIALRWAATSANSLPWRQRRTSAGSCR